MKSSESFAKKFGQNLSESLGVRAGQSTGPTTGNPPGPPGQFPRESSPDDGRTRARQAGHMEVDRIVPDPDQPRKEFVDEAIDRLSASLLKHGQLMPIRVRWNATIGKWVVISGERRYRAAMKAGLKTVACIFADDGLSPSEILQEQIVENLLREDLKPVEQARAYRQLMDLHGWTAKELAAELQVSQGSVSKSLMLLNLPGELQEQVEAGTIAATAAYEVAKVQDPEVQRAVAQRIVDENLTRDDAAEVAREATGRPARPAPRPRQGRGDRARPVPDADEVDDPRGMIRCYETRFGLVTVSLHRPPRGPNEYVRALDQAAHQAHLAFLKSQKDATP